MDLSSFQSLMKTLKNNRFENDFLAKEKIGRGGFASVYKAQNRFDGQFYAIKKIRLSVRDVRKNLNIELQKVLSEAKFLASVNHSNILRYFNSWLEATTRQKRHHFNEGDFSNINPSDSEEPPFVLKGFEDSEEGSPCVVFDRNLREKAEDNSKNTLLKLKPVEPGHPHKLSRFARASEYVDSENASDDNTNNSQATSQMKQIDFFKNRRKNNLPKIGDEVIDSITLYIQTELCAETLEDYLSKRNSRLEKLKQLSSSSKYHTALSEYLKQAFSFSSQIINAVSHIHSKLIVHRDLKPGNIFLVGDTIKIGDFGLVKQLNSFTPIEASPLLNPLSVGRQKLLSSNSDSNESPDDGFRLEYGTQQKTVSGLIFQKAPSDPIAQKNQEELCLDVDASITRSVGTKTFASPEQLSADKDNFDHRADIFSLGVILLLLFHPMKTVMEQNGVIKNAKNSKLPEELESRLPEISILIKKMMSPEPSERPSLSEINRIIVNQQCKSPDLTGELEYKKENTCSWAKKYFKLIGQKLMIFNSKHDQKAEQIYELDQWKLNLKGAFSLLTSNLNGNECGETLNDYRGTSIELENPMQLGSIIRRETFEQTKELFEKMKIQTHQE